MQSNHFSFKSEVSRIRGTREKEQPKRRNWDRYIYMGFLGLIVLAILYYLVTRFLFIYGEGTIITNQMQVRAPTDIQITSFHADEGDQVESGDILFSYRFNNWKQNLDSLQQNVEQKQELNQRLFDLNQRIDMKITERSNLQEQIQYYQDKRELIRKEVSLDVLPAERLQTVQDQLVDLRSRLTLVQSELRNLYNKREQLRERLQGKENLLTEETSRMGQELKYRTQVDGDVLKVFKQPKEIVIRSEKIMTIRRESNIIYAQILFRQEYMKYLEKDQELNIVFDNGETSYGVITEMYSAQNAFSSMNQGNQTLDLSKRIIVRLEPPNDKELAVWKENSDIGVTASAFIY